ncbi:MAG: HDIG domain-containing protein [Opitutaceae bacterium]|nr:HDIG domain-containing protein [Opitutaceae bacterium]
MPFSEQFKALLHRFVRKKRKKRKTEASSSVLIFLEKSPAVSVAIFVTTVAAIVLTSFIGIKHSGFKFLPNQLATIGIAASEDFTYQSAILTDRKREQLLTNVSPVYRTNMTYFTSFSQHVNKLLEDMDAYASVAQDLSAIGAQDYIHRIAERFNMKGDYRLSDSDLTTILEFRDAETRRDLIETGLISLRESYKIGIYDKNDSYFDIGEQSVAIFKMERGIGQRRLESTELAQTSLRIAFNAENVPPLVSSALGRFFRDGVQPNLERDEAEIQALRTKMLESFEPVIVRVRKGASIIEPNTRVTQEQYEQHVAYIRHLDGKKADALDYQLVGRALMVMAMLIAATFYIRLEDRPTLQSNARLGLLALVVVCNLAIVRLCFELGNQEKFLYDSGLSAILPYITPTTLAPLLIAILMGSGPGLLTALMVSLFSAVMFGNRLELMVMSFLASCVAIFICRNIRKRSRVVTAGFVGGLCIATFTFLFNWSDGLPMETILSQIVAALVTGLLEGVIILGVLPILEGLFKRTTDITLLELSDYNHPILRRLQLEAPGTWHHSLMVANLAENACNAIKGNALLARVSCMFHDIGKIVKPEYFTENQLDGRNPHDRKTASFSALIIKSHVKEGVDLGLTVKLPRPIIDIIRQHHGTNLIRYFYHKAVQQAEAEASDPGKVAVLESTYRYDGPKPQFKESAVILLADSIEAASRSLPKATPQNIEELVDRIFKTNLDDGQLDECAITMSELAKIKESFNFTLLNSLHSRIAYPGSKNHDTASGKKTANERKSERSEASASQ